MIAAVIPPRRIRPIQRAVTRAVYVGRLPGGIDTDLRRAALAHQRRAARVLRDVFTGLLCGSAGLCAVVAVVGRNVSPVRPWLIAAGLAAGAVTAFVVGGLGWRPSTTC